MMILTDAQVGFIKSKFYEHTENKTLYAVADGIQDDDIYGKLLFPGAEHLPLMDDSIFGHIVSAPPFLIELSEKPEKLWESFTDYLISHQLGKHNTIFFQSHLDLTSLYTYLQDYLYPFGDNKRFLRFYDPRVFPQWIRGLNLDELNELFSVIDCFWCEVQEQEMLVQFLPPSDDEDCYEKVFSYSESVVAEVKSGVSNE